MDVGIELYDKYDGIFLKLLNARWKNTEKLATSMKKCLKHFGIKSGTILDLFCGNGRISVNMAKLGYKAVAIDASQVLLDDGKLKAKQYGVSSSVSFINGDVKKLKEVVHKAIPQEFSFDAVVYACAR